VRTAKAVCSEGTAATAFTCAWLECSTAPAFGSPSTAQPDPLIRSTCSMTPSFAASHGGAAG
jgi:hypothetical protein